MHPTTTRPKLAGLQAFYAGIAYFFKGLHLLTHPRVRRFAIIPVSINLVLFLLLICVLVFYFGELVIWVNGFLPWWLHWFSFLLGIFLKLLTFILLCHLFVFFGAILSAPFNSFLSEAVEETLKGEKTIESAALWTLIAKEIPRTLSRECQKLIYYASRILLIVILFFIPVVNACVPALWMLFSSWAMAMEYIDYPMDNHKISFLHMRAMLGEHRLLSLGFGFTVLMASLCPILNLIVIPTAVAGATVMWVEWLADKR